jgi:crossover junction endodeoxyribonuclease RuvC
MIILGVDPGSNITGFAIARALSNKTSIFDYGYLKMSATDSMPKRVAEFHRFLTEKIITHAVTHLAIETPFLGKNPQSFVKLGYLRSILYLLSQHHSLILHELAPCQIKQAVTGYGKASKEQVATALTTLFPALKELGSTVKEDVTDAIAIALTGVWAQKNNP